MAGYPHSHIPPDLIEAYTRSLYHVNAPKPFTMRIGQPCPELKVLFVSHSCASAIFLTAWNPQSQIMTDDQNRSRQMALTEEIKNLTALSIPGYGEDPLGQWPIEECLLILNLSLEAGQVLGRKYDQNALVCCAVDAVPRLILLR